MKSKSIFSRVNKVVIVLLVRGSLFLSAIILVSGCTAVIERPVVSNGQAELVENQPPAAKTETPTRPARPSFRGLTWYRNSEVGLAFFYPLDWQPLERPTDQAIAVFGPAPEDPETYFAVELKALPNSLEVHHLPGVAGQIQATVEQLPGGRLVSLEEWSAGSLLGLEVKYTFQEQGHRRKRWQRVLYQDERRFTLTAQG